MPIQIYPLKDYLRISLTNKMNYFAFLLYLLHKKQLKLEVIQMLKTQICRLYNMNLYRSCFYGRFNYLAHNDQCFLTFIYLLHSIFYQ